MSAVCLYLELKDWILQNSVTGERIPTMISQLRGQKCGVERIWPYCILKGEVLCGTSASRQSPPSAQLLPRSWTPEQVQGTEHLCFKVGQSDSRGGHEV